MNLNPSTKVASVNRKVKLWVKSVKLSSLRVIMNQIQLPTAVLRMRLPPLLVPTKRCIRKVCHQGSFWCSRSLMRGQHQERMLMINYNSINRQTIHQLMNSIIHLMDHLIWAASRIKMHLTMAILEAVFLISSKYNPKSDRTQLFNKPNKIIPFLQMLCATTKLTL